MQRGSAAHRRDGGRDLALLCALRHCWLDASGLALGCGQTKLSERVPLRFVAGIPEVVRFDDLACHLIGFAPISESSFASIALEDEPIASGLGLILGLLLGKRRSGDEAVQDQA